MAPREILLEAVANQSGWHNSVTMSSGVRLKYAIDNHHRFEDIAPLFLWSNIEADVAIICACLPTMMPLVKLVRKKLGSQIAFPCLHRKALSPSKPQWPHSRERGPAWNTDRDSFTHLADGSDLSTATSRAWTGSLPGGGTAGSSEEALAMGKLHVRNDLDVSHDLV